MRSHGRLNQRRGNRSVYAQRGCNTCVKPCPQPCEPEWGCGTNYIEWCDTCGNKFHSLLTSAPNAAELDTTMAELATNLAAIYNTNPAVTPALVNSLGIFDPLSTLVYSDPSVTIPAGALTAVTVIGDTTLIGNSLAPADLTSIPNGLAAALQAIKLANPGSTLTVTDSYQVLTNELVSFTLVGTITGLTPPLTGTYTFTIVALAKIVDCGLSPPIVVSGTVTNTAPPSTTD